MTDVIKIVQQQQNVKPQKRKRSRASNNAGLLETSISESQAEYLQELRRLWEDAS